MESSVGEDDTVLFPRGFNFSSSKPSRCWVAHPGDPPQLWLEGKLCTGKAQAGAHHPTPAGQQHPRRLLEDVLSQDRSCSCLQEVFRPTEGTFPVMTGLWFNLRCI